MKTQLRALALLALLLVTTACPRQQDELVTSNILTPPAEEATPTPTPYEDPADCRCYFVNGKRVCNSACAPGVVKF